MSKDNKNWTIFNLNYFIFCRFVLVILLTGLYSDCDGYILTTKDAKKFLLDWKRDFDMNFGFQLRKIGIGQNIRRSEFLFISISIFLNNILLSFLTSHTNLWKHHKVPSLQKFLMHSVVCKWHHLTSDQVIT